MNIVTQDISFAGTLLTLTNQRVLFWKAEKTLILSDLHIGKAAHFRKYGIALPSQVTERDLQRLAQLIQHFQVKRILIVGDLIHAGANTEVDLLRQFISTFSDRSFVLIKGNHDRFTDAQWNKIGIHEMYEDWLLNQIHFIHQAPINTHAHTISGHLHPGVSIRMPTQKSITFPCFVVSAKKLVLPAFSLFTGVDTKTEIAGSIRYAFNEDTIFGIPEKNR